MKTKQYKTYPVILIWCFIQEKITNKNREIVKKTKPEWRILYIYPDRMELKIMDRNYVNKVEKSMPISRHIEEIIKWVREVENGDRKYIAKVVR